MKISDICQNLNCIHYSSHISFRDLIHTCAVMNSNSSRTDEDWNDDWNDNSYFNHIGYSYYADKDEQFFEYNKEEFINCPNKVKIAILIKMKQI